MSAGARLFTAFWSGALYAITALPAVAAAAWLSPAVPAGGRAFGVASFTLVAACAGALLAARYRRGGGKAARTPLWVAGYALLGTALLWGYGHAWLLAPEMSRFSILAPLAGLVRGVHFALALVISASPVLMPAWWLANRVLLRHAAGGAGAP